MSLLLFLQQETEAGFEIGSAPLLEEVGLARLLHRRLRRSEEEKQGRRKKHLHMSWTQQRRQSYKTLAGPCLNIRLIRSTLLTHRAIPVVLNSDPRRIDDVEAQRRWVS